MPKATQKSGAKSINGACVFCNSSCENEELLGKKLARKNLTVHYFCMLFASGLCQSGKDELDGILGFLPRDIIKEVQRGKKLKCCFCKEKGATIGCVVRCCRQVFHFGCGRDNGVLNQFFGTYSSYCEEHRPRQTVPTSDRLAFHGTAKAVCAICMCAVEARASNETLRAPCCKNAWFHRSCIQRQATCSGVYFFKCPLCNNKDYFQHEMLEFGIYIPDQDAEWELEPDAYQELLERHCRCDKVKCQCPKGREYNKDGSKWEIILCVYCGCQGTHMQCSSLKGSAPSWTCDDCFDIARRSKKGQARSPKFSPLHKKNDTNWLMEKFNKEKLEAAGQGESSADKKRKYSSDSSEEEHRSPHQKKRKHFSFTSVSNSATNSSDLSKSTSKQGKRKYKKRQSTLKKDLDEDFNKDISAGKSGDSASLRRQRRSGALTQIPLVVTGKTARLLKGLEIDMTPKHNLSSVRPAIIAQEAPKTLGNELRKLAISMTPKFDYSSMAIGPTSDSFKSQKKKGHSPAKNDSESAITKSPAEKTDSVVNASKSACTCSKTQCAEAKSRDLNIDVEDLPPKITGRSSIKRLTLEDMKKEEKGTSTGGDPTSTRFPKGLSVPSFTEVSVSRASSSSSSSMPSLSTSEPVELNARVVKELKGLVIDMTPKYGHPVCGISGGYSVPDCTRPCSSLTRSSSDSGIESSSSNSNSLPCPDISPAIDLATELDDETAEDLKLRSQDGADNCNVEKTPRKNELNTSSETYLKKSSSQLERELKYLNIDMTSKYSNPSTYKSAEKSLMKEKAHRQKLIKSANKATVSLKYMSGEANVIQIMPTKTLQEQNIKDVEVGPKSALEKKSPPAEPDQDHGYTRLRNMMKTRTNEEIEFNDVPLFKTQELKNLTIDMNLKQGFLQVWNFTNNYGQNGSKTETEGQSKPQKACAKKPDKEVNKIKDTENTFFSLSSKRKPTISEPKHSLCNELQLSNGRSGGDQGNEMLYKVEGESSNKAASLIKLNKQLDIDMTPKHTAHRHIVHSEGKVSTRNSTQAMQQTCQTRTTRIRRSLSYDDLKDQENNL